MKPFLRSLTLSFLFRAPRAQTLQAAGGGPGDTGGNPDIESALRNRISDLQKQVENLKQKNHALQNEKDTLSCEVANMKATQESPDFEDPDGHKEGDTLGTVSDDVSRKRLWRICKRNADGILG